MGRQEAIGKTDFHLSDKGILTVKKMVIFMIVKVILCFF